MYQYQSNRAKTSLESHLMNRVMSSIRESSAGNARQQAEEERKGTAGGSSPRQAHATQNRQRRRQTELSQIIKLASDIKSANQPAQP